MLARHRSKVDRRARVPSLVWGAQAMCLDSGHVWTKAKTAGAVLNLTTLARTTHPHKRAQDRIFSKKSHLLRRRRGDAERWSRGVPRGAGVLTIHEGRIDDSSRQNVGPRDDG